MKISQIKKASLILFLIPLVIFLLPTRSFSSYSELSYVKAVKAKKSKKSRKSKIKKAKKAETPTKQEKKSNGILSFFKKAFEKIMYFMLYATLWITGILVLLSACLVIKEKILDFLMEPVSENVARVRQTRPVNTAFRRPEAMRRNPESFEPSNRNITQVDGKVPDILV